jgi:hypothetical protein
MFSTQLYKQKRYSYSFGDFNGYPSINNKFWLLGDCSSNLQFHQNIKEIDFERADNILKFLKYKIVYLQLRKNTCSSFIWKTIIDIIFEKNGWHLRITNNYGTPLINIYKLRKNERYPAILPKTIKKLYGKGDRRTHYDSDEEEINEPLVQTIGTLRNQPLYNFPFLSKDITTHIIIPLLGAKNYTPDYDIGYFGLFYLEKQVGNPNEYLYGLCGGGYNEYVKKILNKRQLKQSSICRCLGEACEKSNVELITFLIKKGAGYCYNCRSEKNICDSYK